MLFGENFTKILIKFIDFISIAYLTSKYYLQKVTYLLYTFCIEVSFSI